MAKQIVVTESSFLKLKAELEYLKNVKRKEAAENVGIARSFGDLSENSEYDEAKNEQAKIEVQISELEETIAHAKVISDHEIQTDVVNVGVTVAIFDMEFNEKLQNLRKSKGLTQEELADIAELDRTYITSVECGRRNISIINIEKLAIALKVTLKEFFDF